MDNLRDNPYARRLIEEWQIHGKIIVAVDYDDTLRPWKFRTQEQCDEVIKILRVVKEVGAYLVVFTACKEDRYEEIFNYCKEKELIIDSINKNPIELPYGNQNKIYANIFIDDRAGLEEALNILEFATYTIRSSQHNSTIQTVEF